MNVSGDENLNLTSGFTRGEGKGSFGTPLLSVNHDYSCAQVSQYGKDTIRMLYGKEITVGMNLLDCASNKQDRDLLKLLIDGCSGGESQRVTRAFGELVRQVFTLHFEPVAGEGGEIITAVSAAVVQNLSKSADEWREEALSLRESQRIAHIGSWSDDLNGHIEWSDETYEIFGISPSGFIPSRETFINALHPDDREKFNKWLSSAFGGVTSPLPDCRIVTPDGTVRAIRGMAQIRYDEAGKPAFLRGVVQDITALKKIEDERNSLMERITDAFVAIDKNWCYTYVNKRAGEILDRDPSDLVGKNIWVEFPHGVDLPFYHAYHRAMNEQVYIYLEEYYAPYKRWLENHIYPSPDGLTIYFRDITERKRAEEEVKRAHREKQTLLDRISDSVISVDSEWRYTFLNKAALSTHPAGMQGTLGKVIWEVHPEMVGTTFWDKYHEAMQTGRVVELENYYAPMNIWFFVKVYPSADGLTIFYKDITERKKAQENLDKSEKRFRALIENISDAIVINDSDSKLIYQSPSVTRILGYSPEERKDKLVISYVHPDDREKFANLYKVLHKNPGRPFPFQYRVLHKNGSYIWLEGVVTNLLLEPTIQAIVANYRDISDRKEAEERLLHERTLLRTLIDNLPDYIYVKDTKSRFLINNKADLRLMNSASEADIIGKTAIEIFGPEIGRPFHESDESVFNTGEPVIDLDEVTINAGGKRKYLLTTKVPLKDTQNNVIGLVGISRDVTRQKEIELDLRNTNYFLESAQKVGKIGHWVSETGLQGKLHWSAETCRIFGLDPDEFDGDVNTFFRFVHPEDLNLITESTQEAIRNRQPYSVDHRIILTDGTQKWVHEQGEVNYDVNGQPAEILGIVQDITERKNAENEILKLNSELEERVILRTSQLQAANRELEAFTYSVSHDLRSPLRIIDGYSQILKEDYVKIIDADGQKVIEIIMANAKKMGQLIDDLLNFSRIGRSELRKTRVNMKTVIEETLAELQLGGTLLPDKIKINELNDGYCDVALVKHVWINLLSNAVKYSSTVPSPEIEVGMVAGTNKATYFVRDNGVGFDMNYYHKLFGVFQRLHGHNEFSGTGVGLAIVQRIVLRHDGSVWAESKLNEGTTFFFTLD